MANEPTKALGRGRGRPRSGGDTIALPLLTTRRNKDGSLRYHVRHQGPARALTRLPDDPNAPDFYIEYLRAVRGGSPPEDKPKTPAIARDRRGTMEFVANAYMRSAGWRELKPATQNQRRREIARLTEGPKGAVKVAAIAERHIRGDIGALSIGAAENRLKAWRQVMQQAVDMGIVDRNVSLAVKAPKRRSAGHRAWTSDERAQFRERWRLGTPERWAFEFLFWGAMRRGDACHLRWSDVQRDGWLTYSQQKTGARVQTPFKVLPDTCGELRDDFLLLQGAMEGAGAIYFIENTRGQGRAATAFGNFMAKAVAKADLPSECVSHGLRKARIVRLRELGWGDNRIMAWSGHMTLKEVNEYGRDADRRTMLIGR